MQKYKSRPFLFFTAYLLLLSGTTAVAETASDQQGPFSVILEGGSVWKGSGSTATVKDIGIRGDKIVAIGDLSDQQAEQRLDVSGLAVVPGFIDIHSHATGQSRQKSGLFLHPDAENYIRQGVTTAIGGPDGGSD